MGGDHLESLVRYLGYLALERDRRSKDLPNSIRLQDK